MEDTDVILWSEDYLLKWPDFAADSNPSAFEDSSSSIKFHYTWTVNSEIRDGKIFFVINDINLFTQFLRHLSWVREGQDSLELLKHEQGHFDLAEMTMRTITEKIRSKLHDKKFPTRGQNEEQQKQFAREDSGMMIAKELEQRSLDFSQKRKKYDDETEFGHNVTKQKEYDQQFAILRR